MLDSYFDELEKTYTVLDVLGKVLVIGFRKADNLGVAYVLDNKENIIPLVRIHSQCVFGDVMKSLHCDCYDQLNKSIEMIKENGSGAIIYLFQEGRGAGLLNKIKAYELMQQGLDTVEAYHRLHLPVDQRDYDDAIKIIELIGYSRINLLTNNPLKIEPFKNHNVKIIEIIPLEILPNKYDHDYLKTKKEKMHHNLQLID